MQFRVYIPDGCEAGQIVRIHLQDGTEANVKIPNGLFQTGDSFIFDLPTHQMQNPQKLYTSSYSNRSTTTTTTIPVGGGDNVTVVSDTQIDNSNLMTATASIIVTDNNSHDGDDDNNNNNDDDDHNNNNNGSNTNRNKSSSSLKYARRSFLEREINDCQDFILALSVGLLVGSAIVIGFLFGILHVTASYPIDNDGNLIRINHITVDDSNNNEINGILNSPSPSPEIIETIEVVNEAMQLLKQ